MNDLILNVFKNGSKQEIITFIQDLSRMQTDIAKDYCDIDLGHGAFGKVYISRSPKKLSLTLDGTHVQFPVAIKRQLDQEDITEFAENVKIADQGPYVSITSMEDNLFTEALNSIFLSELFAKGISPHFVVYFGFAHCGADFLQFMENLNTRIYRREAEYLLPELTPYRNGQPTPDYSRKRNINSLYSLGHFLKINKEKLTAEIADYILVSFLHSLLLIQRTYRMTHFDTHLANILVKQLQDVPYFRGKDMSPDSISYLAYEFQDKGKKHTLYFPNPGFLIKLGDPGIAQSNYGQVVVGSGYRQRVVVAKYPRYPEVDHFIPEYIKFIREFMAEFGLPSPAFATLHETIPFLGSISMEDYNTGRFKSADAPSVSEVLMNEAFDAYRRKPKGVKAGQIMRIGLVA